MENVLYNCLLISFRALFRAVTNSKPNLKVKLILMITVFLYCNLSQSKSITSQKTVIIIGNTVRMSDLTLLLLFQDFSSYFI
jgi:hypothetical protein